MEKRKDAGELREQALSWLTKYKMKVRHARDFMEFRQMVHDIRALTGLSTVEIHNGLRQDLIAANTDSFYSNFNNLI